MNPEPLVSCIMPTVSGRETWQKMSTACWEAQTYQNRELIIVDGPGKIGQKRNIACSKSKGEIICHWDDDDWCAPDRIRDQVDRLLANPGCEITGYHRMTFVCENGEVWEYRGSPGYAIGTSLCYWKKFWSNRPFLPKQIGEDNAFQQNARVITVPADDMIVATIHSSNTSIRKMRGSEWWRIEG